VKKLYPKPLAIVGDCIRSMICAAPGHVRTALISIDRSRVLAWLAGEEWKQATVFTTGPGILATNRIL
jgi:hypothetical protein